MCKEHWMWFIDNAKSCNNAHNNSTLLIICLHPEQGISNSKQNETGHVRQKESFLFYWTIYIKWEFISSGVRFLKCYSFKVLLTTRMLKSCIIQGKKRNHLFWRQHLKIPYIYKMRGVRGFGVESSPTTLPR